MKAFNAVVCVVAVGVLMTIASSVAAQQDYPSKPIRLIVPFPPGGGVNLAARIIGQKLTENWGQQVVVDNRPGGNSVIGSEALVRSPPDGYTLMVTSGAHVTNPLLLPSLPYDSIKDFAPVATVSYSQFLLTLSASVPANNLQEFIALAKSKPKQLNYASSGNGSTTHLAAEYFNILAAVKTQHIPYKGSGQALSDLISGQVQFTFNTPSTVISHIKSGKLKAIAITGESRLPTLPQVPTFTEAGLPGLDVRIWFGVLAPAGTPKEIIDKLSSEIAKILATPDLKEKLYSQAMEPFISTPEQFDAMTKAEIAKWTKVIKDANIKLEK